MIRRGRRCGRRRSVSSTPQRFRYPSDVMDEEWKIQAPNRACQSRRRKREVDERENVNAIMYVLSTGSPWRASPKDFRRGARYGDYLASWSYDGTLERIDHALYANVGRKQAANKSNSRDRR